jgi:hypothetical protein
MSALWNVHPCGLVEGDRPFRGAMLALIMDVIRTSETSVYFHETTKPYVPENCHLQTEICFHLGSFHQNGVHYKAFYTYGLVSKKKNITEIISSLSIHCVVKESD